MSHSIQNYERLHQPWLVAWEYNTKREQLDSFEIRNMHVTDENVIIICAKVL
jgi:hypothetical protein